MRFYTESGSDMSIKTRTLKGGATRTHTESGCQRSIKTRTLKGGALADKARGRGLIQEIDFYQPGLVSARGRGVIQEMDF